MKIENNKIVSVTYELKDDNNNVIEVSDESNPLIFPYGLNMLLPAFENELLGKETGEVFEVKMNAENGYGKINDFMIVDISKDAFKVNGEFDTESVKIGNRLPMMSQDGDVMNGLITDIRENEVTMDFNHPLAGKNLHFTGKIIEIRDATEEELAGFKGEKCDENCDHDSCDKDCKH